MSSPTSQTEEGIPILKRGVPPLTANTPFEKVLFRRKDLWIPTKGGLAGQAHDYFNGPFKTQKELTWQDWKAKNLRQFQHVLFDRMDDENFNLIAIKAHDKHAVEDEWPNLSRRELTLIFETGGNYAVKCGPTYNLLIVDLDPTDSLPRFWKEFGTLTCRTAHGYHLYFRYKKPLDAETGDRIYPFLCESLGHKRDLHCCGSVLRYGSGHGAYALVPLSIHPTGAIYQYIDYKAPIVSFSKVLDRMTEAQRKLI